LDVANENYLSDPIQEAAFMARHYKQDLVHTREALLPFAPTGRRLRQRNQSGTGDRRLRRYAWPGRVGLYPYRRPQTGRDPGSGPPAFDPAMLLKLYL